MSVRRGPCVGGERLLSSSSPRAWALSSRWSALGRAVGTVNIGAFRGPMPPPTGGAVRYGSRSLGRVNCRVPGRMLRLLADGGGGGALLIGGLDSEEASLSQVLGISGGRVTEGGSLPTPTHDACAGEVGGVVYLFGGGEQSSFSSILRVSTSGTAEQVGSLPTPASDVACVTAGATVYVIGGNTGTQPLRTILAWQPAREPRVVATLAEAVAVRGRRGDRRTAADRGGDERRGSEPRGLLVRSRERESRSVSGNFPTA